MRIGSAPLCAVALAGCYSPAPPVGAPRAADLACPDSQTCSAGVCVAAATGSCLAIASDGGGSGGGSSSSSGELTIPQLHTPIVLDGDLSDWQTCFVTVDPSTAGLVRDLGADGRFASGRFSLAADADAAHLYVAAEVTSVLPLGDAPLPDIYKNNGISVYLDGDGTHATASYGADAAQLVVDHANREQAFHGTDGAFAVRDFASAAATGSATFTIELSVDAATFGLPAFGSHIGFDIGLVGGDGSDMTSELVWYQACAAPECGCKNGDAAPYCDAREFGTATFAPEP